MSEDILTVEGESPDFEVGLLYNASRKTTLKGFRVWEPETIDEVKMVKNTTYVEYNYNLYKEKVTGKSGFKLGLGISAIDSNLIKASGAVDYMNSNTEKKELKHIVMVYKKVARSEELNINKLMKKKHDPFPRNATHVISHIDYADYAVFTFAFHSIEYAKVEKQAVNANVFMKILKWFSGSDGEVKAEISNANEENPFHEGTECRVFSTVEGYSNITMSYDEVIDAIKDIGNEFGRNKSTAVPVKSTLYSLNFLKSN